MQIFLASPPGTSPYAARLSLFPAGATLNDFFPFYEAINSTLTGNLLVSTDGFLFGDFSIFDFICARQALRKSLSVKLLDQILVQEPVLIVLQDYMARERAARVGRTEIPPGVPDVVPGLFRGTPLPEQRIALRFLLERKRAGNFSAVGVGKTATAILWASTLLEAKKIRKLLVVTTVSGKITWSQQFRQFFAGQVLIAGAGTQNVQDDLDAFSETGADVLVAHYDALMTPQRRGDKLLQGGGLSPVAISLASMPFDAVVLDEFHKVQRPNSKRANGLGFVLKKLEPDYFLALSATPVSETPANAFHFLQRVAPDLVSTYEKFESRYVNIREIPLVKRGQKPNRYTRRIRVPDKRKPWKRLDELNRLMTGYYVRWTADQVTGMPQGVRKAIPVTLNEAQAEVYRRLVEDEIKALEPQRHEMLNLDYVFTKLLRLRQVLSLPEIIGYPTITSEKVAVAQEVVGQTLYDSQAKVVVWSVFKLTCRRLEELLQEQGVVLITGDIPEGGPREDCLGKFLTDPKCRVLVATPQCLGESVNIPVARTAIHVDRTWSLLMSEQTDGRILRRGMGGTCVNIDLVAYETIDEGIQTVLQRKREMKRTILSDGEDVGVTGGEVLDWLKVKSVSAGMG